MVDSKGGRWEALKAQRLADPEMKARYDHSRRTFAAMRQVVEAVDCARADAGLSKADLARVVDANPSVIRRLLTGEGSNPTLKTLLELSEAVGLRIRVERVSDGESVAVVPELQRDAEPTRAHVAG